MSTEVDPGTEVDRLQPIWDETLAEPARDGGSGDRPVRRTAAAVPRHRAPGRPCRDTDHEFATTRHDLFLVRLAGFYHDAIYDIPFRELTNEEGSARLSGASSAGPAWRWRTSTRCPGWSC